MYRDKSNQSGDRSQAAVLWDLVDRGWIVSRPESRDSVYDLVVDRGNKVFETVQVKTMCGNSIAKIIDRSGERVSHNGKTRNSVDYAAEGIDWLAGYNPETNEIHYYKLDTYSQIPTKSFSTNKWKQDGFPVAAVPNRHAKRGSKKSTENT
jgi:hypothetical protein